MYWPGSSAIRPMSGMCEGLAALMTANTQRLANVAKKPWTISSAVSLNPRGLLAARPDCLPDSLPIL